MSKKQTAKQNMLDAAKRVAPKFSGDEQASRDLLLAMPLIVGEICRVAHTEKEVSDMMDCMKEGVLAVYRNGGMPQ